MGKGEVDELKAGDYVYLSGTIYTARDAAHKRMYESLKKGEDLPFDIKDSMIYYMGPSPKREGQVIGSAGPTTASRMDKYTTCLLDLGLRGMIGKGKRNEEVRQCALLSKKIKKSTVIAYDDLGTEAIRKLEIENFPVIVVIDSKGGDLYESAIENYRSGQICIE